MATLKTVRVEAKQVDGFRIEARSRQHVSVIDQPPAGGGIDAGATPLEYLFVSLSSCVITIGHIIARQRHLSVRGIEVTVEGELNTDVFQGKSTESRAGFTAIRVHTKIDADMTQQEKEQFVREIDARCPISDNVHHASPIDFVVE